MLDCLSSLYLSEEVVNMKNVYNIIQNDAKSLSELKFSLSMSKRGLISLMTQIDAGINQPDMYMAVSTLLRGGGVTVWTCPVLPRSPTYVRYTGLVVEHYFKPWTPPIAVEWAYYEKGEHQSSTLLSRY